MVNTQDAEDLRDSSSLRVGGGRSVVNLEGILPHDGFTTILDPLVARVVLFDGGHGRTVLTTLDVTSVPDRTLERAKQAVSAETGAPHDQVIVVASHTFSAPHVHPASTSTERSAELRNDAFEDRLVAACADAARIAVVQLRAARVETARGDCPVGVNRDVETSDGWGLGMNESSPTDPRLDVLTLRGFDGTPIAVLVNVAVQPSVMNGARGDDGGLLVSGDLAGVFCALIEDEFPGSTAFFLPGAAGDQAPRVDPSAVRSDPYSEVRRIAHLMRAEVARCMTEGRVARRSLPTVVDRAVVTVPGQQALPREKIAPTRTHRFTPDEPRDVPLAVLRIGGVRLLCVQPELSVRTGQTIRSAVTGEPILVVTMADGAAKYLPEAAAYQRITYEALSSSYAQGAAETVASAAVHLLKGNPGAQFMPVGPPPGGSPSAWAHPEFDEEAFAASRAGKNLVRMQEIYDRYPDDELGADVIAHWAARGVRKEAFEIGTDRAYAVFTPTDLDSTQRYALVYVSHGGREPINRTETRGFPALAGIQKFIAVLPWNGGPSNEDVEQEFPRILDDLLRRGYPVDLGRVYAVGYSAGSDATGVLACVYPDVLAAVSPSPSGNLFAKGRWYQDPASYARNTDHGLPFIAVGGTLDGGDRFPLAAADHLRNFDIWMEHIVKLPAYRAISLAQTRAIAESSPDPVKRAFGIDFDRTFTADFEDLDWLFGDFLDHDGVARARFAAGVGLPHAQTASHVPIIWDFLRHFSKNESTGASVHSPVVLDGIRRAPRAS
ncbi:hypothetical protein NVV95_01165 [Herbiconiux sp. CPCC 205716]|uniref:Uncharacterized protein n=1 Tax=Herbiconiux gentiana TaxID=2970912 RepID=A0ABT2GAH9_9MICO|nr:hypothetical protein [Herbiconiux gentiana]MCS5713153.1 hypothetical protein [Herbiconiux gentiana]